MDSRADSTPFVDIPTHPRRHPTNADNHHPSSQTFIPPGGPTSSTHTTQQLATKIGKSKIQEVPAQPFSAIPTKLHGENSSNKNKGQILDEFYGFARTSHARKGVILAHSIDGSHIVQSTNSFGENQIIIQMTIGNHLIDPIVNQLPPNLVPTITIGKCNTSIRGCYRLP